MLPEENASSRMRLKEIPELTAEELMRWMRKPNESRTTTSGGKASESLSRVDRSLFERG